MSSPIIIGKAGDKYEQMAAVADAQELQQEMFAGLVQMVTENVIGNLLNSPIGIVYYDENGEVCEKEKSSGYEPEKQNLADSGYDLKSAEVSLVDGILYLTVKKIKPIKVEIK